MFRIEYFEFLHILVVYLVLGIGADDVYVFKDTFCHVKKARSRGPGKRTLNPVNFKPCKPCKPYFKP